MKYKIHIIDDEPIVRKSLRDYLNELGYDVDVSEDAASGIEKIKYKKPDLVLLDLCLPDKDGIGVLREILKINIDNFNNRIRDC
jgi:DNA-binding response OmpR family regulator